MRQSKGWRSAIWLVAGFAGQAAQATLEPAVPRAAQAVAERVLTLAENDQRPFAIVDKQAAMLMVYHSDGRLAGATPVLLGRDQGDHTVPGVGSRTQGGQLQAGDRTTPAGRFDSEPGHNLAGEALVWIDYASALAIHRLRSGPSEQSRAQRLASPHPKDRRVSAGCVVVPVVFYETVVQPLLGRRRGVVVVMAEEGVQEDL